MTRDRRIDLIGTVFATIYKAICKNLEGIKSQNLKAYHAIMAELYMLTV